MFINGYSKALQSTVMFLRIYFFVSLSYCFFFLSYMHISVGAGPSKIISYRARSIPAPCVNDLPLSMPRVCCCSMKFLI